MGIGGKNKFTQVIAVITPQKPRVFEIFVNKNVAVDVESGESIKIA